MYDEEVPEENCSDHDSEENIEASICDELGMHSVLYKKCVQLLLCCTEPSDFDELLCEASECGNYSPFHSKSHALAYMLIQSPRPMVKTHDTFIFHII